MHTPESALGGIHATGRGCPRLRPCVLALAVLLITGACAGPTGHISSQPSTTASPSGTPSPTPSPTTSAPPAGAGTWRLMSTPPDPTGYVMTGVWTGSEFLLHGLRPGPVDGQYLPVDAAYNPATNTWRRLPASPYPVVPAEGGTRVLWTGTEMLAFGLMDAAYSPATNTWRPLAGGPYGPSAVVWTGHQVLAWGGGCCSSSTAKGYAYDVATNVWQPMPAAPLAARYAPGVWTGTEMVIVGGWAVGTRFADGAAYNPLTRTWRRVASMPQPASDASVTWTGKEVLVVGGEHGTGTELAVAAAALAYNPVSNTWRRLPDMPMSRYQHMAVWTGDQLLVWGGELRSTTADGPLVPPHGVAYDPVTNRWSSMPASPLVGRTDAIVAWTGRMMLVWGGMGIAANAPMDNGAVFQPARQS